MTSPSKSRASTAPTLSNSATKTRHMRDSTLSSKTRTNRILSRLQALRARRLIHILLSVVRLHRSKPSHFYALLASFLLIPALLTLFLFASAGESHASLPRIKDSLPADLRVPNSPASRAQLARLAAERRLARAGLPPALNTVKLLASASEKKAVLVNKEEDVTKMSQLRRQFRHEKLSIIVLYHNEHESMKSALKSWIDNGLIDYADEILFFLNGVKSEDDFHAHIPEYEQRIPAEKRRIQLSEENLPLGLAITRMIELTRYDYVLLLEKDWELIEDRSTMSSRLTDSKVLVGTGMANVVRHRHRHNPGVPLHALVMHQGREESILRMQKNLLCYTHHWQEDPTVEYPGQGKMRYCGNKQNSDVVERNIYCASSEFCQWTNNPCVFKKKWFIEEVGNEFKKQYALEKEKYGTTSPFLDFEYYTNWRSYAWTDKNFTVAVGTGLFRHAESEQQYFNTEWYARYRLTVDFEEIRNMYLQNETAFKKLGGVHYDVSGPPPPTMMERYPVEFVRKFQFPLMFTADLDKQREMVNNQLEMFQSDYRILTDKEWRATGPKSAKATKFVNFLAEISALNNVVEKAMMMAPPKQPHEMNITLVTCLLDLGRDKLGKDGYQFNRDFKMYLDAAADWLTHEYKKVVYTSKEIADELLKTASEEVKASTKFVYTSREELRTKWIGPDNYDRIQTIRKSPDWLSRASWLKNSPQAGLDDYNALVMSKMYMMRDAARTNYWGTSHFVFVDSKHNCRQPKVMTPRNDHILRAHMFGKFLLTHYDYTPTTEIHGFEYVMFNRFCNLKEPEKAQLVKIGRGGIFGGSAFVLEYITAMYEVALTATLRQDLMGTEENIFSILFYQVPQYIDAFSNNWACADEIKGDHSCKDKKDEGYNCAIFEWIARDAVRV